MYEVALPKDDDEPDNVVVGKFGEQAQVPAVPASGEVEPAEQDQEPRPLMVLLKAEVLPRLDRWYSDAVVGDTVFGKQPASIATLVRQYWIDPPQFVREAGALRVLYGLYGLPVVAVNVTAQTLLLIIRYPSLLAATITLSGVVYLVSFVLGGEVPQ